MTTTDTEIRIEALKQAVECTGGQVASNTRNAAEVFYDFLKGRPSS